MRRIAALAATVATIGLLPATPAEAGTATVYSCRNPDGTPNSAAGWTIGPTSASSNGGWSPSIGCAGGGSLSLKANGTDMPVGTVGNVRFLTPGGTEIRRIWIDRATQDFGENDKWAHQMLWYTLRASEIGAEFDACRPGWPSNCPGLHDNIARGAYSAEVPADVHVLDINGGCGSAGYNDKCEVGVAQPRVDVYSARLSIVDLNDPVATSSAGGLVSDDTFHGTVSARVSATDVGMGLRAAGVTVDGSAVDGGQSFDLNGGACQHLAGAPWAYSYNTPSPCKLSGQATVSVDSARWGDGPHAVEGAVYDASGNQTKFLSRTVTFDNLPATVSGVEVRGEAVGGQSLTCSGKVDGQSPALTYKWFRAANDGSGLDQIPNATGSSYVLQNADVGKKVLCELIATDRGGSGSARSSLTSGPFDDGGLVKPGPPTPTASTATATAPADSAELPGLKNPVTASGDNGAPVDDSAVLSVRFERGSGTKARRSTRVVAPFTQRVRIRGTLTTKDGKPIAEAKVQIAERGLDGVWRLNGGTVTRKDGSLVTFTSAGGNSRLIKLVYFPHGGSDANRASSALSLVVRQDAVLRVSKTRLRNGQTLKFRVSVRGAVPSSGARVALQVKLPTGWYTFRTLQATRRRATGLRANYRFLRTTSRTSYRFRVRVVPRTTTAHTIGYSAVRRVVVRP